MRTLPWFLLVLSLGLGWATRASKADPKPGGYEFLRVIPGGGDGRGDARGRGDPAIVYVTGIPTTAQLNDFGKDGWSLVLTTHSNEYIFQRPK